MQIAVTDERTIVILCDDFSIWIGLVDNGANGPRIRWAEIDGPPSDESISSLRIGTGIGGENIRGLLSSSALWIRNSKPTHESDSIDAIGTDLASRLESLVDLLGRAGT